MEEKDSGGCGDGAQRTWHPAPFILKLDELDKFTHAWIRIHLQFHTSTEDTLVQWLTWLTVVQVTWVQSLVKSAKFWQFYFIKFI